VKNIFIPCVVDKDNTNAQNLTVKEILKRLDTSKYRIFVFCEKTVEDELKSKKNIRLIPWRKRNNALRFLAYVLFYGIDILFYPRYTRLEMFLISIRRFMKFKIVTHVVHSVDASSFANENINKLISSSDYVFGNSDFVSNSVEKYFHRPCKTIWNGINFNFFYPPLSEVNKSKRLKILFVGSFQKRKRIQLVIKAAADNKNSDFHLVGRYTMDDLRSIYNENLPENMVLYGQVSQKMLGEIMRESDIFIFPSINEGHPQVLGQASACGLPIIAMDIIKPDYVKHGFNGFLAKTDEQFFSYIKTFINNPESIKIMSKNAIQKSKNFDWDKASEEWKFFFRIS